MHIVSKFCHQSQVGELLKRTCFSFIANIGKVGPSGRLRDQKVKLLSSKTCAYINCSVLHPKKKKINKTTSFSIGKENVWLYFFSFVATRKKVWFSMIFFYWSESLACGRACVYDDTFLQRRIRFNVIPLKNYSELFCSNSYFFFSRWNIDIVLFSYLAHISVYHILTQMDVGDWAMPSEYFNYSTQCKRCIITRYTLWSLSFLT